MFNKNNPEPGIYNISIEEYHSSAGISSSQLRTLNISPYHFWYKYLNPDYVEPVDSEALIFGSAFHTYVLENHLFFEEYYVAPVMRRGTKAYDALLCEVQAEGKVLLFDTVYERIKAMGDSMRKNDQVYPLLQDITVEQSIYWNDPTTGLLCKCRPDAISPVTIIDLKTTKDAEYYKFRSDSWKKGYHIQSGMIHEAFKHVLNMPANTFTLIAHEKVPPFINVPYPMAAELLQKGIDEFHRLLGKLKECQDTGLWPAYEAAELTFPAYLKL